MREGESYLGEYQCGNRAYRATPMKLARDKCPFCRNSKCGVVWIMNEATGQFEVTAGRKDGVNHR